MSWINLSAINSTNQWQYTPEFTGAIVRLRHTVSEQLPYGAVGLIAQNFNDGNNLELHNVKKIFPFYGDDILTVINPFTSNQRLAIRGQTKYQTNISWIIFVDVWQGESNLINSESLNSISDQLSNLSTNELTALGDKLTTIQESLELIDTNILAQTDRLKELDAGIFTLASTGFSSLLNNRQTQRLRNQIERRLNLDRGYL